MADLDQLLQAIETLCDGARALDPARVAELLGGELGDARAVTEHRVEVPILRSPMASGAAVIIGGRRSGGEWAWALVRLAPTLELTLADLEARFDGHHHGIALATAHRAEDGLPEIRHVDHRFEIAGGTLVASVPTDSSEVIEIIITAGNR